MSIASNLLVEDLVFFGEIGYAVDDLTFQPLFEANGKVYIKFMSDEGLTDRAQAETFTAWLRRESINYEILSYRSFHVRDDKFDLFLRRVFPKWVEGVGD